jgi:catechol 2,3-dioxygenase-like lactoylglutathione lyase family enzyme
MDPLETITETAIYVDDLDAAESFYRDVLGLEVIGKQPNRSVFFRVGDGVLLAFNPEETIKGGMLPSHGTHGPGHFALGIRAESVGSWKARLESHGVAIELEFEWPRGGRSLYFRDPSNNSVELATPGIWGLPAGW